LYSEFYYLHKAVHLACQTAPQKWERTGLVSLVCPAQVCAVEVFR